MIDMKVIRAQNNHMTQAELAEKSGVCRVTISTIEKGKVPSVRIAKKLAAVLNFDWRDFYD
jgi:DNA-binding XRE family transcriptional regulator